MTDREEIFNKEKLIFAQLGQRLSATSVAETAAEIITNAADELLGWDACYVILYDPQQAGIPRPLLAMDIVDGKRTKLKNVAPDRPSPNMLRAIAEGGFIKQADASVSSDPGLMFGDPNRRAESGMFVPIRAGERVIGILSIQRYIRGVYTPDSLSTLKTLADQCAGALERIWAQETVSQLAERRSILYNATKVITASLDLEQLYVAIYYAVKQVMPCDDFIIDGYDESTNEIGALYVIESPNARMYPPRYYADHGLAGQIVHTSQSIIFDSVDEMKASGIKFELTGSEDHTQSVVAVPILFHNQIKGMISAQSYQANSYTNDDLELLEMLAAHAAIALENAKLFSEMQEIADKDPLTSPMYNRRKFYELAEREFARAKRYPASLSAMMLDVDHFKNVNDQFGHKIGDLVLKMIAQICMQNVRNVDIVGRHGGEEFIILFPATNAKSAAEVAERIRRQVVEANINNGGQFFETVNGTMISPETMHVTVSIGIAELDGTYTSIDILVDHADRAMYLAKNEGRNRVKIWSGGKVTAALKSSEK
ncbi:MAG: diguanylate cyclase [Anaerolineales bacterium]